MSGMVAKVRTGVQACRTGLGGELLGAATLFALITGLFAAV